MGIHQSYDDLRRMLRGHHLPALVCDLDAFDANMDSLSERAGSRPIRVATKSVRCRALIERALAHKGFQGAMCFTAGEAAFLASSGIRDLLVAYPTVDRHDLRAVCASVADGANVRLMVDDRAQVEVLANMAEASGVELSLCVDMDVSSQFPGIWFGVRRSPLRTVEEVIAVASAIDASSHLRLDALMGYEAQIAGLADKGYAQPWRGPVTRRLKARSAREVRARRANVVRRLRDGGFPLPLVNGGGTGSLETTAIDPSVTEVTAGSGLFAPHLFDNFDNFRHRPALFFALPVTRRPAEGIVTCHGGGYVASGPAGKDRLPEVFLPNGGALLSDEGVGEVQTPVQFKGPVALELGDPIFFRHPKSGEVCERFSSIILISDGAVVDEVPTYRGEGKTFL
jgi:D-serine deaminase-like pyridoxal phosphate-dependent protein